MQEELITWYRVNNRDLPWRKTTDPYCIWLSEIMCQQTQVATVIPYYQRFLEKFPTIEALSEALEDDVYKLWEGLGYYSRAKRLMLCAKAVVDNYNGVFPKTYKAMASLPGIGPYTAGAILSIAYGIKEPAIDGNVMRVYSRYYGLSFDVGRAGASKAFEPYVRGDLPEAVSDFNQGLMELGARICTPTNPKCEECPIREHCVARLENKQGTLPIKTKKPPKKHKSMAVLLIECQGKYLLEKRPTEGLLANLWGIPIVEHPKAASMIDVINYFYEHYGMTIEIGPKVISKKHVFTHLIWDMTLYQCKTNEPKMIEDPQVVWEPMDKFSEYALPTAFLKLLG